MINYAKEWKLHVVFRQVLYNNFVRKNVRIDIFSNKVDSKEDVRLEQILKSIGGHTVCFVGYSDET